MATITTTIIPFSSSDLNRPGAGAEQWHDQNTVNIPTEGTNTQRLDVYWRFTWARIETSKDVYNWSYLISLLNDAINKKQKVSFGIMSVYHDNENGVLNYDSGYSSYPLYLHQLMQSESIKDWKSPMSGGWVPNYNSQNYIGRLRALNTSLNNLLETGSFNGVRYKDIINSIDIRGYGNYGEWHNGGIVNQVSEIPSGAHATTASLKAIIDAHTQTLPNFQLSIIMTAFDANWLQHTRTAAEVGYYALTTSNAYGKLGWRRDNWGAGDGTGDTYIDDLLIRNNRTYNGIPLNSLIMEVWKYAPVTGEPMNSTSNSFSEFEAQVRKYHANSFGNGNITFSPSSTIKANFRASSKAAGYRLQIEGGSYTNTNTSLSVTLNWRNSGIAPTYDNWNVQLLLKNSAGQVVNTATSVFKPKRFLPSATAIGTTDNFTFSLPQGTYTLAVKVVDPTGFRSHMPLFIDGIQGDGSYNLGSVTVTSGTTNQPPTVNAGADRSVTTSNVTVSATANDDGSIASVLWTRISGSGTIVSPTNLVTDISGLAVGINTFRVTVTDNQGLKASDDISITLQATNTLPVVNAGIDQTITLPTTSTTLTGTASDAQGPVTTVWSRVSGTGVAVSPTSLTTQIVNLAEGISVFRLVATDSSGAQAADNVTVTVKPAPVTPPRKVVNVDTISATYRITYDDGTTEQITS